jgi:hypothetical protein
MLVILQRKKRRNALTNTKSVFLAWNVEFLAKLLLRIEAWKDGPDKVETSWMLWSLPAFKASWNIKVVINIVLLLVLVLVLLGK